MSFLVATAAWLNLSSAAKDIKEIAKAHSSPLLIGNIIPDDEIEERMIEFGKELMKRKDAVRMKTLTKQLKRKHCTLSLAAPGTNRLNAEQLIQRVRRSVLVVGSLYQCDGCKEWHLSAATGFRAHGIWRFSDLLSCRGSTGAFRDGGDDG